MIDEPKKKECNCGNGKKTTKIDKSSWRMVYCQNCENALLGEGPRFYDVHIRPMKVSQTQINEWISEGYEIIYAY